MLLYKYPQLNMVYNTKGLKTLLSHLIKYEDLTGIASGFQPTRAVQIIGDVFRMLDACISLYIAVKHGTESVIHNNHPI